MDIQGLIDTLTGTIQIGKLKLPTWIVPVVGGVLLFLVSRALKPAGGESTSGDVSTAPSNDAGLAGLQAQIGGLNASVTQNKTEADLTAETLTTDIGNLRTSVAADKVSVENAIAANKAAIEGTVAGNKSALENLVAGVQNQISGTGGLINRITGVEAGQGSLINQLGSLLSRVTGNETAISGVSSTVSGLSSSVNSRFNELQNQLGNAASVAAQGYNIALGLNTQLNGYNGLVGRVGAAETGISGILGRLLGIESNASAANQRSIEAINASSANQANLLLQVQGLAGVSGRTSALEQAIAGFGDIGGQLASANSLASSAKLKADIANGGFTNLRAQLYGAGADYQSAESTSIFGNLRRNIGTLQTESTTYSNDIAKLKLRTDWLYTNLVGFNSAYNRALPSNKYTLNVGDWK